MATTRTMDNERQNITIAISRLKVWCIIGIYSVERIIPHRIRVSVVCTVQLGKSKQRDDLENTIDYTAIAKRVRKVLKHHRFGLLETAVNYLCEDLLMAWKSIQSVETSLAKKSSYGAWYRVSAQRTRLLPVSE